jgi:hypothetical protein
MNQTIQDVAVIAGMFFLRIGLPLLLVMGVGYLIQRWLEPKAVHEQFEGMLRNVQEQPAAVRPRWEITGEVEQKQAACAQGLPSDIPCWLARQIAGRPLPEGCATCQVRGIINAQLEAGAR